MSENGEKMGRDIFRLQKKLYKKMRGRKAWGRENGNKKRKGTKNRERKEREWNVWDQ